MALHDGEITAAVLGVAIAVHRHLGPGLLDGTYRRCLVHELQLRGVAVASKAFIHLEDKTLLVPPSYRIDLPVSDRVIVEIKAVDQVTCRATSQACSSTSRSGS